MNGTSGIDKGEGLILSVTEDFEKSTLKMICLTADGIRRIEAKFKNWFYTNTSDVNRICKSDLVSKISDIESCNKFIYEHGGDRKETHVYKCFYEGFFDSFHVNNWKANGTNKYRTYETQVPTELRFRMHNRIRSGTIVSLSSALGPKVDSGESKRSRTLRYPIFFVRSAPVGKCENGKMKTLVSTSINMEHEVSGDGSTVRTRATTVESDGKTIVRITTTDVKLSDTRRNERIKSVELKKGEKELLLDSDLQNGIVFTWSVAERNDLMRRCGANGMDLDKIFIISLEEVLDSVLGDFVSIVVDDYAREIVMNCHVEEPEGEAVLLDYAKSLLKMTGLFTNSKINIYGFLLRCNDDSWIQTWNCATATRRGKLMSYAIFSSILEKCSKRGIIVPTPEKVYVKNNVISSKNEGGGEKGFFWNLGTIYSMDFVGCYASIIVELNLCQLTAGDIFPHEDHNTPLSREDRLKIFESRNRKDNGDDRVLAILPEIQKENRDRRAKLKEEKREFEQLLHKMKGNSIYGFTCVNSFGKRNKWRQEKLSKTVKNDMKSVTRDEGDKGENATQQNGNEIKTIGNNKWGKPDGSSRFHPYVQLDVKIPIVILETAKTLIDMAMKHFMEIGCKILCYKTDGFEMYIDESATRTEKSKNGNEMHTVNTIDVDKEAEEVNRKISHRGIIKLKRDDEFDRMIMENPNLWFARRKNANANGNGNGKHLVLKGDFNGTSQSWAVRNVVHSYLTRWFEMDRPPEMKHVEALKMNLRKLAKDAEEHSSVFGDENNCNNVVKVDLREWVVLRKKKRKNRELGFLIHPVEFSREEKIENNIKDNKKKAFVSLREFLSGSYRVNFDKYVYSAIRTIDTCFTSALRGSMSKEKNGNVSYCESGEKRKRNENKNDKNENKLAKCIS